MGARRCEPAQSRDSDRGGHELRGGRRPGAQSRMGASGCGGRRHSAWRSSSGRGLRNRCAVAGCGEGRRARRVGDWTRFRSGDADHRGSRGSRHLVASRRRRRPSQMWRVLRPGGRMAVAVWASLEETPAYAAEVEPVERMAGARSVPAGPADGRAHSDGGRIGFPAVPDLGRTVRFASPAHIAVATRRRS